MGRCEKTLSRLSRCHEKKKKKVPQLGKFCSLTGEQKFASSLFGNRQQLKAHLFAAEGGKCKGNVFPLPFSPLALESMVGFRYYFTTIFYLCVLPILSGLLYLSAFLYVDNILVAKVVDILQEFLLANKVVH